MTEDEPAFGIEDLTLDLPALVGAFSQRLHAAGMPVTPSQTQQYAHSLALIKPVSRRRLYWATRAIFVTGFIQVPTFDRVFREVFGTSGKSTFDESDVELEPAAPKDSEETPEADIEDDIESEASAGGSDLSQSGGEGDDDASEEIEIPILSASEEEELSEKHFSALQPQELAALYRLMVRLELATPLRRTRRKQRGRHGEHMDMRRTLRNSLRTGGDPIKLARRRRRVHKRRLVLLCDISGSMEPYARAYLQFLHCARASGPDAEAFVFATRLTRLTKQLAGRNPQRAIRRATEAAPDWSSGTRIGDALKEFNDRHGRRGMARGAVVVILSDGWERGDPEVVGREMERLARLAYRIVWVNPRVSAPGFAPKAGGLVAALPYCNALVSGHSLNALDEVADAIAADHEVDALGLANWKPPSLDGEEEQDSWGVAGSGSVGIAMPSGYKPKKGKTAPGRSWSDVDDEGYAADR
ncbi:MAG: VWA domain-containing protein [Solirubrobacterales bacterium]|nr:VWA domain-containing protein [Solirubrobacterales bacterium]